MSDGESTSADDRPDYEQVSIRAGRVNELGQWRWPKKFAQIRTRSIGVLGSPSSSPSPSHPPTLLDLVPSKVALKPLHE